jgi:SAM-dependent methyltransferase
MQFVGAASVVGQLPVAPHVPRLTPESAAYIELCCPACSASLPAVSYHALAHGHEAIPCARCRFVLAQRDAIWLALPIDRLSYYARFIDEYAIVRKAEGRGSDDPNFYLSLPYCDLTQRNSWQWAIRARSYKHLAHKILPSLAGALRERLSALDLGAGNSWLSYCLAALGHRPIAVDLQTDAYDGLGAAIHYQSALPKLFPRFQAELDRLPFADDQFDCAIFNASFHYSENYDHTLAEAIRCLRPGGTVLIVDTPFYRREEFGLRMLEERRNLFQKRFGFKSDGLSSREYLSTERLLALEARYHLEFTAHPVWYGVRWACRPLMAKLLRRREPSQFRIYTAQVKTL